MRKRGHLPILEIKKDVYFVQGEENGPIKIGASKNIIERFKKLSMAHPNAKILGYIKGGGLEKESKMHNKFYKFKMRGEWYEQTEELLQYIKENTIPFDNKEYEEYFQKKPQSELILPLYAITENVVNQRTMLIKLEEIMRKLIYDNETKSVSLDTLLFVTRTHDLEDNFVIKGVQELKSRGVFFEPVRNVWKLA